MEHGRGQAGSADEGARGLQRPSWRQRRAFQEVPRSSGGHGETLCPYESLFVGTAGRGYRGGGLSRAFAKGGSARRQAERGELVHESGNPALGQEQDRALRGSGCVAQDPPASVGRDFAARAAYSRQRRRVSGRPVRAYGRRRRVDLFHPDQRRHSLAHDQIVDGRGSAPRRLRVYQVPRSAEPRRSQARHGRLLRHLQDLRAHPWRDALFATEGSGGLRQGAQVSGFDHQRARREPGARRGVRHAHQADERQPADVASLLPPARQNTGRAADAVLRHLSTARAQRHQVPARNRQAAGARGNGASGKGIRRDARHWIQQSLDGRLSTQEQALGRTHGRDRLRCASVRADELQRRLRIGNHHGARVGARDALVSCQLRAAVRNRGVSDIHRRDSLDLRRAAAARQRAEECENRRRAHALPGLSARRITGNVLPPGDVRRVRTQHSCERRSWRAFSR